MIAAPDVVAGTVDPGDVLRFLTGDIDAGFITSQDDLTRRLATMDVEPDRDGRFRINEFCCRDDTWQATVVALIERADAIVMDLRGFTAAAARLRVRAEGARRARRARVSVVLIVDASTDRALLAQLAPPARRSDADDGSATRQRRPRPIAAIRGAARRRRMSDSRQENRMTLATDLADCSALTLLALYRSGDASPVEATRAVLDRIERFNPILNAFCHLAPDEALAAARASEARWQRGAPCGELDGVPVSVKDLILAAGWPTLRGSRTVDPAGPWDVDAPATARLREAGAVILGKTATPEFGCKGETNSPLTGITRNPWNPAKTPGGSSGGTAAAVASGMGPLSVGTDGAGSVRIPAAFCGNFGLKPSFGRVPAYPLSPMGTVAHLGPHAMSVADAALMMNVLKRPDARDWTSLPYDPADYTIGLDDGIRGLRIAFSPTLGYAKVDPEVAAAVAAAVAQLQALGAHVEAVDPGIDDPLEITIGLWFAGAHAIWSGLTPGAAARSPIPTFAPRPSSARRTARSTSSG